MTKPNHGLTLVELLVVVGLIALLALIALPNLLDAATRTRVSRVKTDLRTLSTAIETYGIDRTGYPDAAPAPLKVGLPYSASCLGRLSTPVAYLANSHLPDPFSPEWPIVYANMRAETEGSPSVFDLLVPQMSAYDREIVVGHRYALASVGPDGTFQPQPRGEPLDINPRTLETKVSPLYDPTNGTVSNGDITRTGLGQL